ncbi:aldehyde dehydrogenase family protein, partial [Escherichia coli]|uniref:aldehyde dehydrogenase family protein n=3 Tax=Pseudomonadota TaxID=1224 RepID=UPI003D020B85
MSSTAQELARLAETIRPETKAFIDGRFVDSASGKSFNTINPATGKVVASVAETDREDVDRAVAAARSAFNKGSWRNLAPRDRKVALLRLADLVEKHQEEFAVLECLDTGKPVLDALNADVPDAIATLRWHAEAIDKIYDAVSPTSADIVSMVVREPIGVVGAVIPWNFPL